MGGEGKSKDGREGGVGIKKKRREGERKERNKGGKDVPATHPPS